MQPHLVFVSFITVLYTGTSVFCSPTACSDLKRDLILKGDLAPEACCTSSMPPSTGSSRSCNDFVGVSNEMGGM
ncbi:hypothetical protein P8C59_008136 [Phyllachora maydis]|uniref:Uncharacterized protein n=1 Tax=Phyllachora maydis TaxID=1825666 RepID=A0AAD9MHX4_9PEZI|nr:hypothetical protein P8C59_008136 [Phyllachora maydis]